MAKLLDANAIMRFLLNDIPEQADKTANVIYDGAFTKEIVIAEVVYVLSGVYNLFGGCFILSVGATIGRPAGICLQRNNLFV